MARRTKEEALETRHKLLDAAEYLFQMQGVSRTSLQDIAKRAGATRGAVYWHFKDKADLFNAMMERVTLPMEQCFLNKESIQAADDAGDDAARHIREATHSALAQIVNDAQTRRVFEVATHKVEYVEELQAVRQRHIDVCTDFLSRIEFSLTTACRQLKLTLPVSTLHAARGLHAMISGLIQDWLLEPEAFDLMDAGRAAIDVNLRGLGLGHPAAETTTPGKPGVDAIEGSAGSV